MNKLSTAVLAAIALVASVFVAAPVGASSSSSYPAPTYTVTIENLTGGQYLTPPNWAAHDDDVGIFERGDEASAPLQQLAENGAVGVLADELAATIDAEGEGVSGVGSSAPIAPGGTATWSFTTDERQFSLAAMIICTNDGFGGIDSRRLPKRDGQTKTYRVRAYDAGTELNTELHDDLVPAPFCGGGGAGTDMTDPALAEDEDVRRHRGIRGVGDLDSTFDWDGPVATVTVTRNDPAPTYTVTLTNTTAGQYITPPNWAAHDNSAGIFSRGATASAGLQQVAENGGVPVLAAELTAAIDANGLGISGVGAAGPIGPGESVTWTVTTKERRFSFVGMLICTNDGFAGLDSRRLPRNDGNTRSYNVRAYDAGTEINTELHVDLVPAPFCGGGGIGTDVTDPALAENGVVKRHRTIRGVGDLDDTFDWSGSVAQLSITRNDPGAL